MIILTRIATNTFAPLKSRSSVQSRSSDPSTFRSGTTIAMKMAVTGEAGVDMEEAVGGEMEEAVAGDMEAAAVAEAGEVIKAVAVEEIGEVIKAAVEAVDTEEAVDGVETTSGTTKALRNLVAGEVMEEAVVGAGEAAREAAKEAAKEAAREAANTTN